MMKIVVVLAVIGLVYLLWRTQRPHAKAPPPAPAAAPDALQPMVACAHCGLHLPLADALTDAAAPPGTYYCSASHRAAAGPTSR